MSLALRRLNQNSTYYVFTALAFAASGAFGYRIIDANKLDALETRDITANIEDAYDFVVVGGGLAGLVLGGRLSEDSEHSVLVIEAGGDNEAWLGQINTPSQAYWGELWNDELNWAFEIQPQPGLNGATMMWPRGKGLGGSSAINGLYLTRPAELEFDAWKDMLGGMDGADNWAWDSMYAAMKKSETFTPPSGQIANTADIKYTAASRGTSGPLQVSYPGWASPLLGDWVQSNVAAGIPAPNDMYGGDNWGGYICTSTIDAENWTRSYSRSAYLDPIGNRPNYDVLVNALVSKLDFDTSTSPMSAKSVEYIPNGGTAKKTVNVKKEVILAGGSIGSPAVLLHSGIGPKATLNAAGVDVVMDLPGVGEHLQDHPSVQTNWLTSVETAGDVRFDQTSPEFLSIVNNAVSFPGSKILFGNGAGGVKSDILSSMGQYAPDDSTVKAGYQAIVKTTADMMDTDIGQVEILMGITNDNSSVNVQVTLQHGYSMGRVYIKSNDPTEYPAIDPAYLSNPADIKILTAGLNKAREICTSGPLGNILKENSPGADTTSDADWEDFIRGNLYTEFHPCSTCAMLPKDQGGVVDANLRVYGTSNVRVADASVPPIEFASHLMGSTYGIGEKAADMIKDYWKNPDLTLSKAKGGSSSAAKSAGGDDNSSVSTRASLISAFFAVAACVAFVF